MLDIPKPVLPKPVLDNGFTQKQSDGLYRIMCCAFDAHEPKRLSGMGGYYRAKVTDDSEYDLILFLVYKDNPSDFDWWECAFYSNGPTRTSYHWESNSDKVMKPKYKEILRGIYDKLLPQIEKLEVC